MQKPNILVIGPSGSGKSRSTKHLDKKTTLYLNVENQVLPYKHEFEHHFFVKNWKQFTQALNAFTKERDTKWKHINVLVIDSFSAVAEKLSDYLEKRYTGFDVWKEYNNNLRRVLLDLQGQDFYVIFTAHDEESISDSGSVSSRRCYVQGKVLKGKVEKYFTMALFTRVANTKEGIEYQFATNSDGITSAKTPEGMFDDLYIENDLNMVIEKCEEYYNN